MSNLWSNIEILMLSDAQNRAYRGALYNWYKKNPVKSVQSQIVIQSRAYFKVRWTGLFPSRHGPNSTEFSSESYLQVIS